MNGTIFSSIPLNSQTSYGRTLLFAPRNTQVPEQETIRVMGFSSNLPKKELEPTVRLHSGRYSPYERPTKNELNKPIRITKKVTTTVEIDNPTGFISQELLERSLGITNGENIYQAPVDPDEHLETFEIEVDHSEDEKENNVNETQVKTEKN